MNVDIREILLYNIPKLDINIIYPRNINIIVFVGSRPLINGNDTSGLIILF